MTHQLRFLICCLVIPAAFFSGLFIGSMSGGNPVECIAVGLGLAIVSAALPAISFALSVLSGIDATELTAERLRQPGRSPHKPIS